MPTVDVVARRRPCPAAAIGPIAARNRRQTPVRSISSVLWKSASVISPKGEIRAIAALATAISSPPKRPRAVSTNPSTAAVIVEILVFIVIMFCLAELPLIGYLVAPEATKVRVAAFQAWMAAKLGWPGW